MAKLTAYNIKVCMVVTIAAFSFGFGASVFVTSIGQPGFYNYYELDPQSLRASYANDPVRRTSLLTPNS